jgi:predicted nucleic acid-binding protein
MSETAIIDTSVWIDVLRDKSGAKKQQLLSEVDSQDAALTRFTQLELLQGCRDQKEWSLLSRYLEDQEYIETEKDTWKEAARIYFEVRRAGSTVRSPIDCCIAQLALDGNYPLIHRDRDFIEIGKVRPRLRQIYLEWR